MNQELDPQRFIEQLKRNSNIIPKFCDNCGASYNDQGLQVIGNRGGMVSCRIHCNECNATHILNVSVPVSGVGVASRTPVSVDLGSAEEFNKFAGKPSVNAGDAIDSFRVLDKMETMEDFLKAL